MQITRKQLRYWCYRLKTESDGGADSDAPQEISDFLESKEIWPLTGGWSNFSVTWDINDPLGEKPEAYNQAQMSKRVEQNIENFDIVARTKPIEDMWNSHLQSVAKEMPKTKKEIKKVERKSFDKKAEIDVVVTRD